LHFIKSAAPSADAEATGLLHSLRLLLEREPKAIETIASHKGSQQ
jgi:hypothetical protein